MNISERARLFILNILSLLVLALFLYTIANHKVQSFIGLLNVDEKVFTFTGSVLVVYGVIRLSFWFHDVSREPRKRK